MSRDIEPILPKLTLEWIERTGGWPENAGCAVVNVDGGGWFGNYTKVSRTGSGGWRGTNETRIANSGNRPTSWDIILNPSNPKAGQVQFTLDDPTGDVIYNPEYADQSIDF